MQGKFLLFSKDKKDAEVYEKRYSFLGFYIDSRDAKKFQRKAISSLCFFRLFHI
jgi:hypothetical protein